MAEATAPATPAIDYDKLGAAVAASLGTALADSNKTLLEAIGKLAPASAASGDAGATATPAASASKPLTADDVSKIVGDALGKFATQQQASSAREQFIASKMNDLPAAYRQLLPQTGDTAELAKAEQAIRTQFQTDFKAAGGTTQAVNGNPPAGGVPAGQAIDVSKLTASQKIELGLKQEGAAPRPGIAAAAALQAAQQATK